MQLHYCLDDGLKQKGNRILVDKHYLLAVSWRFGYVYVSLEHLALQFAYCYFHSVRRQESFHPTMKSHAQPQEMKASDLLSDPLTALMPFTPGNFQPTSTAGMDPHWKDKLVPLRLPKPARKLACSGCNCSTWDYDRFYYIDSLDEVPIEIPNRSPDPTPGFHNYRNVWDSGVLIVNY